MRAHTRPGGQFGMKPGSSVMQLSVAEPLARVLIAYLKHNGYVLGMVA